MTNDPPEQRRPASRAERVGNVRVVRRAEPGDGVDGLDRDVLLQRPRRRHEVSGELLTTGAMALTNIPKRPDHRVSGFSTQAASVGDFMTHVSDSRALATVVSGLSLVEPSDGSPHPSRRRTAAISTAARV